MSLEAAGPRPAGSRVVGRVAALWRYPVKSMSGEPLDAVDVSWHGLAGDRRWAFIRPDLVRSGSPPGSPRTVGNQAFGGVLAGGFPWLTMRERPDMGRFVPRFVEPDRPDASPTVVRTPAGAELDVTDPALAAELGDGVRVIKQNRGIFDTQPLSLLSVQTVAGLGALVGAELDARRFRPNILIEAVGGEFPEDGWIGADLTIGGLRLRIDQRDRRCVMVNVDPVTSERDPKVLRTIADARKACLGVYGSTVEPGRVAVGDAVLLDPSGLRYAPG